VVMNMTKDESSSLQKIERRNMRSIYKMLKEFSVVENIELEWTSEDEASSVSE
jgi:hypothetical protein